jgi:hypothetical protein
MANYYSTTRTNYFSVTDEAKFRDIINSCSAEDEIHIFDQTAPDGKKLYGFGCYGSIIGIVHDSDDDIETAGDSFHTELQSVLADGDAIIITEVGHEKLRYLVGCCTVVTKNEIQGVDVLGKAVELARSMLAKPDYLTKMEN